MNLKLSCFPLLLSSSVTSSNIQTKKRKASLVVPESNEEKSYLRRKSGLSTENVVDDSKYTSEVNSLSLDHHRDLVVVANTCLNNSNFTYNGNDKMTCRWIRWKETRRKSLCIEDDVRINCPQSCGLCCENDTNYSFKYMEFLWLDCAWIQHQSDENRHDICNSFRSGRMVRDGCPRACNFCQDYIEAKVDVIAGSTPDVDQSNVLDASEVPSQVSDNNTDPQNHEFIMQRIFRSPAPTSLAGTKTPQSSEHSNVKKCSNNDQYQNPLGGHCGCSLFEATDCMSWKIFMTDYEIDELLRNCPEACGLCR